MGEAKRHHYVPCCQLRHFASDADQKRVWVFDKLERRAFLTGVENCASENHFNTITIGNQVINLEPEFGTLDQRLAELLRKIVTTRDIRLLSSEERQDIALLALVQLQRVKLHRDTLANLPGQLRQHLGYAGVDESVAPDFDPNTVKQMSLGMLAKAHELVPLLLGKHWALYYTQPGSPFWISDNPVIVSNEFGNGAGLAVQGATIRWPISCELSLGFACPSIAANAGYDRPDIAAFLASEPLLRCPREYVEAFNRQQVAGSARFIFSPTDDFTAAELLLDERPEFEQVKTKMKIGGLGPSGLPPGQWLTLEGAKTHHRCRILSYRQIEGAYHVNVAPEDRVALERAMADAPHAEMALTTDAGGHGMRDIELCVDPAEPCRVIIQHNSPGLRQIAANSQRR